MTRIPGLEITYSSNDEFLPYCEEIINKNLNHIRVTILNVPSREAETETCNVVAKIGLTAIASDPNESYPKKIIFTRT